MMVSASLEETQPMMTSSTEGGRGEGGGRDGVRVIIGGDPADEDIKHLEERGGGQRVAVATNGVSSP